MQPTTHHTAPRIILIELLPLDPKLHRLAKRLPRWLGISDMGAVYMRGAEWFIGAWVEQGCRGRSWVLRLGRVELTLDWRRAEA